MSERNVQIVKKIYEAWEQGDFSSAEWADPEIEYTAAGPDPAVYKGVGEMGRVWAEWLRHWQDYRVIGQEFIDAGEEVVVLQTFAGRGKESGAPVDDMRGAAVLTVGPTGKVTRFRGFTDQDEALAAAGVSRG